MRSRNQIRKDPLGIVQVRNQGSGRIQTWILPKEMMRVRVELHGLLTVGGARVSLDRTLKDGEEVCLYPVFSGG
jgi:hypothetical protein